MSQPKPSTILLILAVFACVMLYVLGVGLGAQDKSSGGRSTVSKEERTRLRERFVKPRPVADEDLKATDCVLSDGAVQALRGRPCQVDIAKSGARVRTVNVEPLAGSRVDVKLTPKSGPAVPASLDNLGERRELDVPGDGATLSLTCTQTVGNTPACPVKLR